MDHLHNLDSVHQLQSVQRAIISLQRNIEFSQDQINEIEKYFHYLYSIGYHQGARQIAHGNKVFEVDSDGNIIGRFLSTFEAEMKLGVSKGSIGKAIKQNRKCKGRIFIYGNSNMAEE